MKLLLSTLLFVCALAGALAQVTGSAGPYRVTMTSQPKVIPVGKARLTFTITTESGEPVTDLEIRAIARMPGMFMGEREQRALPASEPGTYGMEAAFPMAGNYEVEIKIDGTPGAATAKLAVRTGQDIGSNAAGGGISVLRLLPWGIGLALALFVIYRVRQSGQRIDRQAVFNRATMGGTLLLIAMLAGAIYSVNNLRRPGAMTPIEAQVMEMNTPAPPGTTAVELATVEQGELVRSVSYSGQAVGFVEQDVNPRVGGTILDVEVYVGDRVKKGQVLARLDTSQLDPQLAERAAMTDMAAKSVGVAAAEYEAALQEVTEAQADVAVRENMVAESQAMLEAAKQEQSAMAAEVLAMKSELASAEAEVAAAEQMARFNTDELARMQELFSKGAISRSELQMAESQTADADSKLRQARSMVRNAEAKVAAAQANARRADAMALAAGRRVSQARSEVLAAKAAVHARRKSAQAARSMIDRERAGVTQARAGYESAAAQRGYSILRADRDGLITQRLVSPGTTVAPGQTILKVAQINPIRLQANVATSDLARVTVGSSVKISAAGGDPLDIDLRISSVSPTVDPQSRLGVVEALWNNPDGRILPGQFVTIKLSLGERKTGLIVPLAAVQTTVGEPGKPAAFVWVAEASGTAGSYLVKRTRVEVGIDDGRRVIILAGLKAGQQVVTRGAAFLTEQGEVTAVTPTEEAKGQVIEIWGGTYEPNTVRGEVGKPLTLTFIRRTEETCGTEVIFPDFKINEPLPLNKPITITITPKSSGTFRFTCGMDMFDGKVVVQ